MILIELVTGIQGDFRGAGERHVSPRSDGI
jgi:hypothetical protein